MKEAFKEGKGIQGGKRHLRKEEVFWQGIFDWEDKGI